MLEIIATALISFGVGGLTCGVIAFYDGYKEGKTDAEEKYFQSYMEWAGREYDADQ